MSMFALHTGFKYLETEMLFMSSVLRLDLLVQAKDCHFGLPLTALPASHRLPAACCRRQSSLQGRSLLSVLLLVNSLTLIFPW